MRIRRVWKAGLLLAVGAAGGGAALAVASVPDSNGVIHACYGVMTTNGATIPATGANLRIIDPAAGQTCNTVNSDGVGESSISWNRSGPRGPKGSPGRSVTVAGGNTLTLAGGAVVTVGSSSGLTINTPTLTPSSKVVGTVELDLGRSSLSFDLYSWSVPTTHSTTGGGSGKLGAKEFVLTKKVDKASPNLLKYCVNGKHIARGRITLRKSGGGGGAAGQPYLVIKLNQVLISSVQSSKSSDTPTESVSLNFGKIKYEYSHQ
jgi:type VI secretion system secreted protein Hcp